MKRSFLGETALWRPKSGFPQTPFRESHKGRKIISISFLKKPLLRSKEQGRFIQPFAARPES